jgi:hypothetical protein
MILSVTEIISLMSVNQLIFVTEECGVLFAVRTEFLIIGFKGLMSLLKFSNGILNYISIP